MHRVCQCALALAQSDGISACRLMLSNTLDPGTNLILARDVTMEFPVAKRYRELIDSTTVVLIAMVILSGYITFWDFVMVNIVGWLVP